MRLHLVRHGRSAVNPHTSAASWGLLHDDAAAGVYRLRDSGALPGEAVWFTSPEPKTVETAALLFSAGAGVLEGIHEAERAARWLPGHEFEAAVRRSFAAPDTSAVDGWEPLAATRGRVVPAVRSMIAEVARATRSGPVLESTTDVDIVVVGHGTAWTVLVADLVGAPPDLDAWTRMTMPDHCCLELEGPHTDPGIGGLLRPALGSDPPGAHHDGADPDGSEQPGAGRDRAHPAGGHPRGAGDGVARRDHEPMARVVSGWGQWRLRQAAP